MKEEIKDSVELNKYKEELIKINNEINEINKNNQNKILYDKKLEVCIKKLYELKLEIDIRGKNLKKERLFGIIFMLLFLIITALSFVILPVNVNNTILIFVLHSLLLPLVATASFENYLVTKKFLKYNTLTEVEKQIEDKEEKKKLNKKNCISNSKKLEDLKIKQDKIIRQLEIVLKDSNDENYTKILNECIAETNSLDTDKTVKNNSYQKVKRLGINSNE